MSHRAHALPVGVPRIRFSFRNHLLPPVIGVGAALCMYGALNFPSIEALGKYYANQWFKPIPAATQSTPSVGVDKNVSEVIIPSVGVKAPVIYESSISNNTIAYALRSGVVHYGTTALPGENGNVVLFGHSSGAAWVPGNYKFVFTLLDKLHQGQQISLDYQGTRYVYVVTGSQVVSPTDMKVLESNGQPELSLITCTPVGTSKNRLVIHARQIRPNPVTNTAFKPASTSALTELPSN